MLYQEIWEWPRKGLIPSWARRARRRGRALAQRLYVDVRDNQESEFVKVGTRPTRFFLKDRQAELSPDTIAKLDKEDIEKPEKKTAYTERDLHPLRCVLRVFKLMPPACPVDVYACCYTRRQTARAYFPLSGDGGAVAGEWEERHVAGKCGCSMERELPPGKPVASEPYNNDREEIRDPSGFARSARSLLSLVY